MKRDAYPEGVSDYDRDEVRHKGAGLLIEHVLDVMENGGVWGEVKFCNNRYSPNEILSGLSMQTVDEILNGFSESLTLRSNM